MVTHFFKVRVKESRTNQTPPPNLLTTFIGQANIPGYQNAKGSIQSAIYTNQEMLIFCLFSFFLVHLLSVENCLYSAQPQMWYCAFKNSLKLSAAVFSTLKLQNSKVISGSHHVDQQSDHSGSCAGARYDVQVIGQVELIGVTDVA